MLPVKDPLQPNSNILVSPLAAVTAASALPDRGTANRDVTGRAQPMARDEATHDRAVGNLKVCCLLLVGADFVGPRPRARPRGHGVFLKLILTESQTRSGGTMGTDANERSKPQLSQLRA